jgi:D-sedoheptulose 7-phosphate isomerase
MTVAGRAPLAEVRVEAGARFFGAEAERLARVCRAMAERFTAAGRLVALAGSPVARSDARHVAVEFVHPVIVGKRALPALALCPEGGDVGAQAALLVQPQDIVIGFGDEVCAAVAAARSAGALTLGFCAGGGAEHVFTPASGDPFVDQELVETAYHVLWELVHVFLDHTECTTGPGGGASSFLYPFLDQRERDLEPVVDDVRRSILMKAAEIGELRRRTLSDGAAALEAAATAAGACFGAGGKLLAFGNGGSATDAMDVVADLRTRGRAAIDLTEDPGILTAIANDIGAEAIFLRQVIAYGRPGDVLLALSTSGGSANVIAALTEARRRGLITVAMVGYDGGRVAAEGLADHVIVVPSENIPRIQEAQASAYHAFVELLR